MSSQHCVRATECDYRSDRETVYEALSRIVDPLTTTWNRLSKAKTIAIKFNQDKQPENVQMFEGQRQQLVSDTVVYAVLKLLRERTDAELFCADVSFYSAYNGATVDQTLQIRHLLDEFGVSYMNGNSPPFCAIPTPGKTPLFSSYTVMEGLKDVDEVVSVAKMKNHGFMGITGALKNLFGLSPVEPHGRPRPYYHHLVRMPYMLSDIGMIYDPALNIIDGLVSQAGQEWAGGAEFPRVTNTLIAGDHPVATDACMARQMGHDPEADWKTDPFLRDRNALVVAQENGYGSVSSSDIDYQSDAPDIQPGLFFCKSTDDADTIRSWRESMCHQALWYRDHMQDLEEYKNQYVLIQRNKVVWSSPNGWLNVSRRSLAGKWIDQSLFFKYVDLQEQENERFDIYEDALSRLNA